MFRMMLGLQGGVTTVVAVLAACFLSVMADAALAPVCGRIDRFTNSRLVTTLVTLRPLSVLDVQCFSYEVIQLPDRPTCGNLSDFSLRVIATNGSDVVANVSIAQMWAGSVQGVSWTFAQNVVFRFDFSQPQCVGSSAVLLTFAAQGTSRLLYRSTAPILREHSPLVIYRDSPASFTYREPQPENAQLGVPSSRAFVTLPGNGLCERDAGTAYSENPGTIPVPFAVASGVLRWTYTFPESGSFLVCVRNHPTEIWRDSVFVYVAGGNPAYFDIPAAPTGLLSARQPYVVVFRGILLDALKDQVKAVDFWGTCESGSKSNAVQTPATLTPVSAVAGSGSPPWSTFETQWSLTIVGNGLFKVCYKREGKIWTEPPLSSSLPLFLVRDAGNETRLGLLEITATNGTVQASTTCASGVAPPRVNGSVGGSLLEMTLQSATLPHNFFSYFATFLCVPLSYINVYEHVKLAAGGSQVVMAVVCADPLVCTSSERMDLLLSVGLRNPALFAQNVGMRSVREVPSGGALGGMAGPGQVGRTINAPAESHEGLSAGVVAAVVLGVVLSVVVLGFVAYYLRTRNRVDVILPGEFDQQDAAPGVVVQATVVEVAATGYYDGNERKEADVEMR